MSGMSKASADHVGDGADSIAMRELGKLTAEQLSHLGHPVTVTSNGLPVAWLVPLTPSQRRRAELISNGRLNPRRVDGPPIMPRLPAITDGPTLSELLIQMREQERT
jgi:antitoxin (DNA-binding transcriptional repressor) of toxin-antitoxin stability system